MVQTRLHKHSLSKKEQAVLGVASRASVRDPINEFQEVYGSRAGSAAFRQQIGSDFSRSGQIQPPIQAKPSFRGLSQELAAESQPVQLREEENKTGLPDDLKAGVEALSGFSMDDVRVHYNSSKPAQLQALAYTQGTEIHVGPGQGEHLPHEAWHVVQQMEGRVKPTIQAKGVQINEDQGLEKEADVMGYQANSAESSHELQHPEDEKSGQEQVAPKNRVIQCQVNDLTEWREQIWENVEQELSNSVYDIEESIENQEIIDTNEDDPGNFLRTKYETENEQSGMEIDHETRFANEEIGGINTVGLRKQLDALSDGVRGRTYELKFARTKTVENRYWIQVGAINGSGGDISVRAGDRWSDERTYQFKSSRSADQGSIDTVIKKAAEQLRGEHGERPYQEDLRIITVEIVNPANFFPGTPNAPARANAIIFGAQFQTRLLAIHAGNGGGRLIGVDQIVIEYPTPVQLNDGRTVKTLTQNMNGNGTVVGAPLLT